VIKPCSYVKQVIGLRLPSYHWILNNPRNYYSVYNYTATFNSKERERDIVAAYLVGQSFTPSVSCLLVIVNQNIRFKFLKVGSLL
jgi:hypothetical protein